MIVVVEGPDGAGKTTLIRNLRQATDRYYVTLHNSGPPHSILNVQCVTNWIEKMSGGRVPLICDRISLISEPIYGVELRGENILEGTYTVDDVAIFLAKHVDRIIYCRPPTSVIEDHLRREPQLQGVISSIREITARYDNVMKMLRHWGVKVIEYDWTEEFQEGHPDLDHLFFGRI